MRKWIDRRLSENKKFVLHVLGDSITWGENHCTSEQTYCAELARLFATAYPECTVIRYDGIVESESKPLSHFSEPITVQAGNETEIVIIRNGIGGNTVRRALNRRQDFIGKCVHGCDPDMFLMMYGINDGLKEDRSKYVTPQQFYENYSELCDLLAQANPSAKVVLMTPSYNDSGNSENSVLDPYCEKVKRLAKERGLSLIDVHRLWMEHLVLGGEHYGQGTWLSGVKGDFCHFSPEGGKATAEFIFSKISKEIGQ